MSIYNKLYSWQKSIVDKFKVKKSFGIWLDMGLGKTPIGMALAESNSCNKVLVISINAKTTETEFDKGSWLWWAKQSSIDYVLKNKYSTEFSTSANECMIINYESLFERGKNKKEKVTIKKCIQNFISTCKNNNVAILVDESHKMKNLQSLQTSAIMKIKKELQRVSNNCYTYLLTGTPFTTGYIDLYSQLKALDCQMTKTEFVDNFCEKGHLPGLLGWQQPIVGYKNLNSLFNLIHQHAITIKSEDVVDLPDKIFVKHLCPVSEDFKMFGKEKAKISEIINTFNRHSLKVEDTYLLETKDKKVNNPFFRNIDYPNLDWLAETSGTNYLRARQLSIGFNGNAEKCEWYDRSRLNIVKTFLQNNENNYVLFYNFTPELLELYDICNDLNYNVDVYCGEIKSLTFYNKYTSMSDSDKLFNNKNIILANFASGATGMNWQEYNQCIIFSCPIYSQYEQGIKRIHRLGQKETCIYHFFYQDNWLDLGMIHALEDKIEYSTNMFESDLKRIQTIINDADLK